MTLSKRVAERQAAECLDTLLSTCKTCLRFLVWGDLVSDEDAESSNTIYSRYTDGDNIGKDFTLQQIMAFRDTGHTFWLEFSRYWMPIYAEPKKDHICSDIAYLCVVCLTCRAVRSRA